MKAKQKTTAQKDAAKSLELSGIVHFLLTEQRCPVIYEGKLAYVSCPGVSKEAFKQAIDKLVARNICAWLDTELSKLPTPIRPSRSSGTGRGAGKKMK